MEDLIAEYEEEIERLRKRRREIENVRQNSLRRSVLASEIQELERSIAEMRCGVRFE